MTTSTLATIDGPSAGHEAPDAFAAPLGLGKRVANIAMTAQIQLAYACALDAQGRAQRAIERIEKTWPATPVRALVLNAYRAQEQASARLAKDVLAGARRRCGLAFARF